MSQSIPLESIKRLDIKPGDVLVATVPSGTTPERLQLVADQLKSKLPDDIKLLVVTDIDLAVIPAQDIPEHLADQVG